MKISIDMGFSDTCPSTTCTLRHDSPNDEGWHALSLIPCLLSVSANVPRKAVLSRSSVREKATISFLPFSIQFTSSAFECILVTLTTVGSAIDPHLFQCSGSRLRSLQEPSTGNSAAE